MKVVSEGPDPLVVAIENAQRAVDSFGRYLDAAQALEDYIISQQSLEKIQQSGGPQPRMGGPQPPIPNDGLEGDGPYLIDLIFEKFPEAALFIHNAIQEGRIIAYFDENEHLYFQAIDGLPDSAEVVRLYAILFAKYPNIDHPYNVAPGDLSPCTALIVSLWLATGRLEITQETVAQINNLDEGYNYQTPEEIISSLLSNPKLLSWILGPGFGFRAGEDTEPLWPIAKNEELPLDYRESIRPNDLVFYVDPYKYSWGLHLGDQEYPHVALVFGWRCASTPRKYYDSYRAARETCEEPVLYVVDRGSHDGEPYPFKAYSDASYSEYSFWVTSETPTDTPTIMANGANRYFFNTPNHSDQSNQFLLAWHRMEVTGRREGDPLNERDDYHVTWYRLVNGLWIKHESGNSETITITHPNQIPEIEP